MSFPTDHTNDLGVVMCPISAELVAELRGEGQVFERVRIRIADDNVICVERLA